MSDGLIALCLFMLFPLAATAVVIWRAKLPARGRILFLRRFHSEQPPNFPVSTLMGFLDRHGLEVITLADTRIRRNPHRLFVIIIGVLVAFLVAMAAIFLPFVALLLGEAVVRPLLEAVGLGAFASFVTGSMAVVGTGYWVLRVQPWRLEALVEDAMAFVVHHFPGGWRDWSRLDARTIEAAADRPIRRATDTGLVLLQCSDANWQAAVEALVRSSAAICIDISNPSEHIETEIGLVAQHAADRVVWLRQDDTVSLFRSTTAGAYVILGSSFPGVCREFVYPRDPSGSLYRLNAEAMIAIEAQERRLFAQIALVLRG